MSTRANMAPSLGLTFFFSSPDVRLPNSTHRDHLQRHESHQNARNKGVSELSHAPNFARGTSGARPHKTPMNTTAFFLYISTRGITKTCRRLIPADSTLRYQRRPNRPRSPRPSPCAPRPFLPSISLWLLDLPLPLRCCGHSYCDGSRFSAPCPLCLSWTTNSPPSRPTRCSRSASRRARR
ncbi:uncharacterized protein BKA78DRAFT_316749 [Phyllosticta capitalensis]|uniref:uncharacterized protein n=1 Tax=Phyllosticta capitalensis TaxID=121624 RepID=UPI00312FA538